MAARARAGLRVVVAHAEKDEQAVLDGPRHLAFDGHTGLADALDHGSHRGFLSDDVQALGDDPTPKPSSMPPFSESPGVAGQKGSRNLFPEGPEGDDFLRLGRSAGVYPRRGTAVGLTNGRRA